MLNKKFNLITMLVINIFLIKQLSSMKRSKTVFFQKQTEDLFAINDKKQIKKIVKNSTTDSLLDVISLVQNQYTLNKIFKKISINEEKIYTVKDIIPELKTPLFCAILSGNKQLLAFLLSKSKLKINKVDFSSNNGLHIAIKIIAPPEVILSLITRGCSINHINSEGYTPYELALKMKVFKKKYIELINPKNKNQINLKENIKNNFNFYLDLLGCQRN